MKKSFPLLLLILLTILCQRVFAQGTIWGTTYGGGTSGGGVLFKTNFDGTNFQKVKDFDFEKSGRNPASRLVSGPGSLSNKFYGTALTGGTYGYGVIFQYDPTNDNYTEVYSFTGQDGVSPRGAMVLYNGKFYGVTNLGGAFKGGVVFSYDPLTDIFTKEADFLYSSTGSEPNGYLTLINNKFYGTTSSGGVTNFYGSLFEFDPSMAAGSNLVSKYDFNYSSPLGELVIYGGLLYGTTPAGAGHQGTIFEFNPAATAGSNYTTKVDFSNYPTAGSNPTIGMTLFSSKLYGATSSGGANITGTIFEYVPGATSIMVKVDNPSTVFGGVTVNGSLLYANNLLYGDNGYSIFSFDPAQSGPASYNTVALYDYNNTGVLVSCGYSLGPGGKLFGIATIGGVAQGGTIMKFDPSLPSSSSNPVAAITFNTSSGFYNPSDLLYLNGKLYGHSYVGNVNRGSIFEYDPSNGSFVNAGFDNFPQSSFPSPPTALNGKLIGNIGSAIYEYDPATHTIIDKTVANGIYAQGLTSSTNGKLYGLSTFGGANNTGYIAEYDPTGNTMIKKLDLESSYSNSGYLSEFFLASNGLLYAVSPNRGGTHDKGYLMEYNPVSGTVSNKYEFETGVDKYRGSGLMACTANGKLYGLRPGGGNDGAGSIFEYTLPTSTATSGILKEVYSFSSTGARFPLGVMVESGNGKLYGTTDEGGDNSVGTLFEYDPILNTYTDKISFTAINGLSANALLVVPDAQTITFNPISSKPYGEIFKPGATASSSLPITYTSSDTNVAIIKGDTIIVKGVGTTTITANQKGNGGYLAATSVQQTLTTTKASQAITFSSLSNKKLNDTPFTLSATASSTLGVAYVSSNPSVASVSGNTVTILTRGSTDIQASQAGNANYNAATPITQTLLVVNSSPTVANVIAEQAAIQLAPLAFTFANNVFVDADGDALTYSATKFDGSNLPTWLTFNAATRTFSGTPGVNDTTATIRLTANDGFSGTVNTLFKIHVKAVQTITFSVLSSKKLNDTPFTLNATASSSLAVTYVSSNPAVASINGNTVTIHARGSTDIQASQAGNDNYNAAVPVTQTLTIVNTAPTVASTIAEQEALQLTAFAFTFANNVFTDADGDALTYSATKYDGSNSPTWLTFNATNRTFSGIPSVNDTTATIRLTANDGFSGTVNTLFKIRIKIITGIEPDANVLIKVYPNPVHQTLIIENESGEVLPVIIRSSLGEVIYQNVQSKPHEVNVLPWAGGLYFVEVRTGSGITQTKIIKY